MMSGSTWSHDVMGGYSFLCALFWLVVLADLILLGIWLWKQISKK